MGGSLGGCDKVVNTIKCNSSKVARVCGRGVVYDLGKELGWL